MRFEDLKRNTVIKAITVVLCIAGLAVSMLGGLVTLYGSENGYCGGGKSFVETAGYKNILNSRLMLIENSFFYYAGEGPYDTYESEDYIFNEDMRGCNYFNQDRIGIGFEIFKKSDENAESQKESGISTPEDNDGKQNEDSTEGNAAVSENETSGTDSQKVEDNLIYRSYVPELSEDEGIYSVNKYYYIHYYLDAEYAARDCMYWENQLFIFINNFHRVIFKAVVVGGIVFVITLVYLIMAAGHRRGRDSISENILDKIPYDVHFAACAIIASFSGLLFAIIYDSLADGSGVKNLFISESSMSTYLIPAIVLMTMISSTTIAFILTSATRFKMGKWWRNTVTFRILRLIAKVGRPIWKVISNLIVKLPLVWKTTAVSAALLLLILCSAFLMNPVTILLSLVFTIVLLAGIVYCSLSMRTLQKGARELASGNEEYRVDTDKLIMDFKEHGKNLNSIGEGISLAVSQKMKSERLKTELITNVSHDLKTPLTSIVNYVDLLEKENLEGKAGEYVQILKRQSERLKKLTADVLDASKASTGNINVEMADMNIIEIVNQATGEYREKLESSNLELIIKNETGMENLTVNADGRLLWRAMDNLMNNICKYSLSGSRVYVTIGNTGDRAVVSFKNISENELDISAEELMERFVRGDSSRSTEGSGLGLNIARSLIEIQGGSLKLNIDGDLFRADIILNKHNEA